MLSTAAASCGVGGPGDRAVPNTKNFLGPPPHPPGLTLVTVAAVTVTAAEAARERWAVFHKGQTVSLCSFLLTLYFTSRVKQWPNW